MGSEPVKKLISKVNNEQADRSVKSGQNYPKTVPLTTAHSKIFNLSVKLC